MTTSPISSASWPTVPSSPTTGSNSTGTNSDGTLAFTQNFTTFLTLLTTQLQNQDPLSPMDSTAFTQQLVSFSEVEQQINTNNNLQQLIQLQNAQSTISSLPLVGDSIEYNAATAPLENGQASYDYSLPSNAAQTELVVEDASGNVVYATTGSTSAGSHSFTWNGESASGQQMPAGNYTLSVIAKDSSGNTINATVQSIGTVTSVGVSNGTTNFDVNGITVPISELVTVNPDKSSSTSN